MLFQLSKYIAALTLTLVVFLLLTPSNAQAQSGGRINVMTAGATGDCTTDDTSAIKGALVQLENPNAASDAHAGELYFPTPPGGCYLISSPIILTGYNINLTGDGRDISIIKAACSTKDNVTTCPPQDMDAVLVKDNTFTNGQVISGLGFDANNLAKHAIDWGNGYAARLSGLAAMNGKEDDIYLHDNSGLLVSDGWFYNAAYDSNGYATTLYNVLIAASSTSNQFTNNSFVNALIANVKEIGGNNHFLSNHGYGYNNSSSPYNGCPQYGFITSFASVYVSNQLDCSTVAGYVVNSWNTQIANSTIATANYGVCISPNVGLATIVSNQFLYSNPKNGRSDNKPKGWAPVVQGVIVDGIISCAAGVAHPTAVWGTDANDGANNTILNNTPSGQLVNNATQGSENIWGAIYGANLGAYNGTVPLVGIGTTQPHAPLDVNGEVRVGQSGNGDNTPVICDAQRAGAIRFDGTKFLGCDGTKFVPFTMQNP